MYRLYIDPCWIIRQDSLQYSIYSVYTHDVVFLGILESDDEWKIPSTEPPWRIMAPRPATGQVLPPNTADLVTQSMRCVNSTNGEKGLLMKLRHLGWIWLGRCENGKIWESYIRPFF
jgi:hypothetical protein